MSKCFQELTRKSLYDDWYTEITFLVCGYEGKRIKNHAHNINIKDELHGAHICWDYELKINSSGCDELGNYTKGLNLIYRRIFWLKFLTNFVI